MCVHRSHLDDEIGGLRTCERRVVGLFDKGKTLKRVCVRGGGLLSHGNGFDLGFGHERDGG